MSNTDATPKLCYMKKKYLILFVTFAAGCTAISHNTGSTAPDMSMWNRATVNIFGVISYQKERRALLDTYNLRIFSYDSLLKRQEVLKHRHQQATGTAIYLEFDSLHFLVTARHVLEDPTAIPFLGSEGPIFNHIGFVENIFTFDNDPTDIRIDTNSNVFIGKNAEKTMISPTFGHPWGWSDTQNDIGVICFEKMRDGRELMKTLEHRGFKAIKLNSVDTGSMVTPGDTIYCLGFPGPDAYLPKRDWPEYLLTYTTNVKSFSILTKGLASSNQTDSCFFNGLISVTHGNSGGPVIYNNRLIGIVHGYDGPFKEVPGPLLKYYMEMSPRFSKLSTLMGLLRRVKSQGPTF